MTLRGPPGLIGTHPGGPHEPRHHHPHHPRQPAAEAPRVLRSGGPPRAAASCRHRGGEHLVTRSTPCAAGAAQRSPRAATFTIDVSISHSTGATSSVYTRPPRSGGASRPAVASATD